MGSTRMESNAFESNRHDLLVVEGLGKDAAAGVLASRDGSVSIANDGWLDRIANDNVSSIRTGTGLQVVKSLPCRRSRRQSVGGVDESLMC